MAIQIGVVEAVEDPNKYGNFAVRVNGTYYSTKMQWAPSPKPMTGDQIEFDDGGKKYLGKVKILSKNNTTAATNSVPNPVRTFPILPTDKQTSIIRQNCLGHATQIILNTYILHPEATLDNPDPEFLANEVIKAAKILEKYATGELDVTEATERKKNVDKLLETEVA